jgi:hypothetical protein
MDVAVLEAQLHEAEADKLRAETDRNVAAAVVGQRENEYDLSAKILNCTRQLFQQRTVDALRQFRAGHSLSRRGT